MKLKKLVLLSSLVLGLTPFCRGQISGSVHDLTISRWAAYNSTGEVCIVCHAPHNTDPTLTPLWNHTTTTQTFVTYSGYKFSNTGHGGNGGPAPQPDGASKMCLSCHDGVTAANQFGGKYQGPGGAALIFPGAPNGKTFAPNGGGTGQSLANTHPISFVYDQTLASNAGGLKDPTTASTSLGGTIKTDLLDANSKMQCSSCHEIHDPTIYMFGKISNVGSALCLTCHNK